MVVGEGVRMVMRAVDIVESGSDDGVGVGGGREG